MSNAYMPLAKTDDWATPDWLYKREDEKYGFTLDAAASNDNHKCGNWFGLDHADIDKRNGLINKWTGVVWCNPPYGRVISQWVEKAYQSDCITVMLLPVRTDTKWFHNHCIMQDVEFIRGRLKFGNSTNSAPFPSMLVRFNV